MAYFSLHAYDADVWIREFRGLNQSDESLNSDPMYAEVAENIETPRGVLQPAAAMRMLSGEFGKSPVQAASYIRNRGEREP